jgi:ABC-type antimicrobial peptide transport system permease subunit
LIVSGVESGRVGVPQDARWSSRRTTVVATAIVLAAEFFVVTVSLFVALTIRSATTSFVSITKSDEALAFDLSPRPRGYSELRGETYYSGLTEAVKRIPGVTGASLSRLHLNVRDHRVLLQTVGTPDGLRVAKVVIDAADPGFFDIHASLVAGRVFNSSDHSGSPRVSVLNRPAADSLGGLDVVGQQLRLPGAGEARVVVGLVDNGGLGTAGTSNVPVMYLPWSQADLLARYPTLSVSFIGSPSSVQREVKALVGSLGKEFVLSMQAVSERRRQMMGREYLSAGLAAGVSIASTAVAVLCLHSLLTYVVLSRRREWAIRFACGSSIWAVGARVTRTTSTAAVAGVLLGAVVSWFGRNTLDPLTGAVSGWSLVITFATLITICLTVVGGTMLYVLVPFVRTSRRTVRMTLESF